jgi:hypothetical protein
MSFENLQDPRMRDSVKEAEVERICLAVSALWRGQY